MMRRVVYGVLLAGSLAWSGGGVATAQADTDAADPVTFERVEVAEAGIAVSFPSHWSIKMKMERELSDLPPEVPAGGPARLWDVLVATSGWDFTSCFVQWFEDMPISLEEHAGTIAERIAADPDWTSEVAHIQLAAGDAFQVDHRVSDEGVFVNGYLLESGSDHYYLQCLDMAPFEDDYRFIAETIELVGAEPPDEPAPDVAPGIVSADAVTGLESVVEVADGLFMSADCELAVWVQFEDDTFREWLSCTLSADPVDPPEQQGAPPTQLVSTSGGECEWVSDYWSITDGSEVYASSYEMTVTPDGRVFGSSTYGAEALDCRDE